jgi:hypothetical protein
MSPTPTDLVLYERVKKRVYQEIPKHSAYRSGILVKRYKEAFSKKYGNSKSPYKGERPGLTQKELTGLTRWFNEKWVNQRGEIGYSKKGDIYRPSRRVTKNTPVTWKELTKKEIADAQKEKKKTGRVTRFKKSPSKK